MYAIGQRPGVRLAQKQMNMFRHNDVTVYPKGKVPAGVFENLQEKIARCSSLHVLLPAITAEGHEMRLSRLLYAYQTIGHANHSKTKD
jgi:hypothetical protein